MQINLVCESHQLAGADQFVHTPSTNILMHMKGLNHPMQARYHGYSSMIGYVYP